MVSMLASSVVDRGFKPRSRQIKEYKIGICCFSAKQAASRRQQSLVARKQDNVSRVAQHVYPWDVLFYQEQFMKSIKLRFY